MELLTITFLFILLVVSSFYAFKMYRKNSDYRRRFSKIISVNEEVEKVTSDKKKLEKKLETLRSDYKGKKEVFDSLVKEVAIYDEEIQLAELGFYKPHYGFDTPEQYKNKIDEVRSKQKQLIFDKTAIYCNTEWTVEGSKSKGRTMTNRGIRLTARAFNNECDSAISSISWNNASRMEARIEKAYSAINKLNESNAIRIAPEYLRLKLQELWSTHEYKEKKQQIKEEQAEIRLQIREEAKLQQEVEQTLKDEEKYQKLLDKAKVEAEKAAGSKLEKLKEKIKALNKDLEEAHAKSERAKSMAQQTRAGHVYVVSNIGSFGEGVHKVGMTRRLDPLDRVKELSDASVPFSFDIHAMIYSEDAPSLENALHKVFDHRRINLVNNRKEFFSVELKEIAKEMKLIEPNAEFIETIEAREYTETKLLRLQQADEGSRLDIKNKFPTAI